MVNDAQQSQHWGRRCCVCGHGLRFGNLYPTCGACYAAAWRFHEQAADEQSAAAAPVSNEAIDEQAAPVEATADEESIH